MKNNVQSIIGSNIQNILLLLHKDDRSQVAPSETLSLAYHQVENNEQWRIQFLKELIEIKHGNLRVDLEPDEIDLMIADICTT